MVASLRASRPFLLPLLLVTTLFALWEWWVGYYRISPMVLVGPLSVGKVYSGHIQLLLKHLWPTAIEAVLGFVFAVGAGIALGSVLTFSTRLRQALYPHLILLQLIPKIALAPLFIIWLGIGAEARLTFALFMAFFPIVISTMTGLLATPRSYEMLCRAVQATAWQTFHHVRVPFALPYIFAGMKIGVTMSVIGIIVGEFITAQAGLGYLIMFGSSAGETAVVFAAMGLLCLVGLALYATVTLLETVLRLVFATDSTHAKAA